jgi:hypothetical protein
LLKRTQRVPEVRVHVPTQNQDAPGAGSLASLNGLSGEKLFAGIIFGDAVNRSKAAEDSWITSAAMKKGFVDASLKPFLC